MSELRFRIGEEVQPKVVGFSEFSTSLFREVYAKAYALLRKVMGQSECLQRIKEGEITVDRLNNIIVFAGERGSGKTSCMLTVVKDLVEYYNRPCMGECAERFKLPLARDARFLSVDLIDPSFFDKTHNIIEVVLGKMFNRFKQDAENRREMLDPEYADRKRALIGDFQKVKENLDHLLGPANSNESLDDLLDLSAGMELKENIRQLVKSYLRYFKNENGFLVLPVDDIDLHTECAYEMVEQVRKYFIQPQVIVLMAVKLDQLEDIIRKHYFEVFKEMRHEMTDSIDRMAERYMTKLIPYEHRLYLPDLYLNQHERLIIESEEGVQDLGTVREGVLKLIYAKTRYLFYNSLEETSPIVPRNLRDLVELLAMLNNMPDVRKERDEQGREIVDEARIYNQLLFKKYFIETWCAGHLDTDMYHFIRELSAKEILVRNKLVITSLVNKYKSAVSLKDTEALTNVYVENIRNRSYNVSLGDVLYVLNEIKTLFVDEKTRDLVFALKTLYSIFLYETYDAWCEATDDISPEEGKKKNRRALRGDMLEKYPDYVKLVGGAYVNTKLVKLLPAESRRGSRVLRRLNDVDWLQEMQRKIVGSRDLDMSDNFRDDLNLFELFYLTTTMRTDNDAYRKEQECYYDFMVDYQKGSVFVFDAMGLFFSLVKLYFSFIKTPENVKTPEKISDPLLKRILMYKENSLLYNILSSDCLDSYSSIQSAVTIRNIEVLEDLLLQKKSYDGGDNLLHLKGLWSSLMNYEIAPHINYNEEKGDIRYDFFKPLVEFCEIIERNRDLKDKFERIYSQNQTIKLDIDFTEEELEKYLTKQNRSRKMLSVVSNNNSVLQALLERNDGLKDVQKELLEKIIKDNYKRGVWKIENILNRVLPYVKKRFEDEVNR